LRNESDLQITGFYSCDRFGVYQECFPIKTTVYFNISVRNIAGDPRNISIYLSVLDEPGVPIGFSQLNSSVPSLTSLHYIMSIFLVKWAHVGVATAYVYIVTEGSTVESDSTEFYIGPEDLTPPMILLLSPENATYMILSIPLVFTIDERSFWTGYSLDNSECISILGNSTLTGLTNGSHSIMIYANDSSGNMGSSEDVYFTNSIVHDLAVLRIVCSSEYAYVGRVVNIAASIQNEGTIPEAFNVTICANDIVVGNCIVTNLPPDNQTAISFEWDTTSHPIGNYTITSYVDIIPGENDVSDNNLRGCWILLTVPGDVNGDYTVDIYDVVRMCAAYGSSQGCSNYEARCDIDEDGYVDIYDVVIACYYYGES